MKTIVLTTTLGALVVFASAADVFARQSRRACYAECRVRYEECRQQDKATRPRCGERQRSCLEDCPE